MSTPHTQILSRYAASFLSLQGVLYLCIAVLLAFAYLETSKEIWSYWIEGYNWQFLVPIAFVYMLWDRKDLYAGLQKEPSILPGLILLVSGCALLIVGQVSSTHSLREISIIVNIFGLVFLLFGANYVRALFWPLIYLVLMLSVTSELLGTLRYPLKLISATVAANALQMSGYAVYRDGTFLQLPHITIEVADSCSGLNQMISSIALGIPIAFTILNQWWKRVIIILVSMMLGLVMNWVRVFLIAIWNYDSAKEVIHGPYGIYELPFIFLVGVFITLAVALTIADKTDTRVKSGHGVAPGITTERPVDGRAVRASAVAILALSITAIYLNTWKAEPIYLKGGFADFPMTIAGFQGKPIDKLEKPFYTGLAQDELIASYVNQAGDTARVYIGYFNTQNQQEELIDYRYNWLHDGAESIELPSSSPSVSMKRNSVRSGDKTITVFFSYDINGRNIIDPKLAKLASVLDALMHRRNNGAIIMVLFDKEPEGLSINEQDFLTKVMNLAAARLPGG